MNVQTELIPYNEIRTAKNAYKLIVESGRPIESVALDIQVSDRLIYYWATGKRSPSIKHLYALSQLFKVPIESILN